MMLVVSIKSMEMPVSFINIFLIHFPLTRWASGAVELFFSDFI